jgi:hypothetical protein
MVVGLRTTLRPPASVSPPDCGERLRTRAWRRERETLLAAVGRIGQFATAKKPFRRETVMTATRLTVMTALMLGLAAVGCTTYYRVTDPASGRKYYTDEYKRTDAGIRFKDHISGSEVMLPASEILEVSKDEYKTNTQKK